MEKKGARIMTRDQFLTEWLGDANWVHFIDPDRFAAAWAKFKGWKEK
jgi:hypothetical protein